MKILTVLLLSYLLVFQGCSLFKSDSDNKEAASQEDSSEETAEASDSDGVEEAAEEGDQAEEAELLLDGEEKIEDTAQSAPSQSVEINTQETMTPTYSSSTPGTMKTYTVGKNETLMLIAFKIYGDYNKWKDLKNWNSDTLKSDTQLMPGTLLKFEAPLQEFVWRPEGLPYLIQNGDTLGIISNKVYGTPSKWKPIWENNRPLIKNPNLIFAGFTLYYKELKDLASLY